MNNYCNKKGDCSRCGNCCAAMLPLTRAEEKKIKEYIKTNNVEPSFFQDEENTNLQCCFFDINKKICKIYEVRPQICRSFKCNRNVNDLEKERDIRQKEAYWNRYVGNEKFEHITDMRLLFYDDPRSLVANIIYQITDGTMECGKRHVEFVKLYLKENGLEELADCIEG